MAASLIDVVMNRRVPTNAVWNQYPGNGSSKKVEIELLNKLHYK